MRRAICLEARIEKSRAYMMHGRNLQGGGAKCIAETNRRLIKN
jgi:hypothetical protein